MQVGILAIGVFDWTERNRSTGTAAWVPPSFQSSQVAGGGAGGQPVNASEYAGRRIVGVVFVVLIFITLVIYGMGVHVVDLRRADAGVVQRDGNCAGRLSPVGARLDHVVGIRR